MGAVKFVTVKLLVFFLACFITHGFVVQVLAQNLNGQKFKEIYHQVVEDEDRANSHIFNLLLFNREKLKFVPIIYKYKANMRDIDEIVFLGDQVVYSLKLSRLSTSQAPVALGFDIEGVPFRLMLEERFGKRILSEQIQLVPKGPPREIKIIEESGRLYAEIHGNRKQVTPDEAEKLRGKKAIAYSEPSVIRLKPTDFEVLENGPNLEKKLKEVLEQKIDYLIAKWIYPIVEPVVGKRNAKLVLSLDRNVDDSSGNSVEQRGQIHVKGISQIADLIGVPLSEVELDELKADENLQRRIDAALKSRGELLKQKIEAIYKTYGQYFSKETQQKMLGVSSIRDKETLISFLESQILSK